MVKKDKADKPSKPSEPGKPNTGRKAAPDPGAGAGAGSGSGAGTEAKAGGGRQRPSSLIDTRVIYCGGNLEQLANLPDQCVDLIYIDPPFNSNRNYEVFWGKTKEKRSFDDRHESTQAYTDHRRAHCVELARLLKKTGSFYDHCEFRRATCMTGTRFTRTRNGSRTTPRITWGSVLPSCGGRTDRWRDSKVGRFLYSFAAKPTRMKLPA
jgi:hypothetical protein